MSSLILGLSVFVISVQQSLPVPQVVNLFGPVEGSLPDFGVVIESGVHRQSSGGRESTFVSGVTGGLGDETLSP